MIEWDEATFEAARKRLAADGFIDARGVRLSLDQRLLDEAPQDHEHPDRRLLRQANFGAPGRSILTFAGVATASSIGVESTICS